jgi:hypothetical protein
MTDEVRLNDNSAGNYLPTTREIVGFVTIFLSMILVFYVNRVMAFKYLAMLFMAIMAFMSNKKFVWIAIFWVIVDSVGGLFTERAIGETAVGIPIINIASGISIGIKDLLILAMIFSVTPKNRYNKINYDHLLFFGMLFFATFIGSVFYDASYKIIVSVLIRGYIIFLLFYTIRNEFKIQTLFQLFHLISYLVPIILIDQIFQVVFGTRIITRYVSVELKMMVNTFTGETRAVSFGMNTLFFSFVYGLLLLTIRRTKDMKIASYFYGIMLVVMTITSVMLSATRGVIGVFGIILLFVSPYLVLKMRNIAIVLGVIFFLFNILGGVGLNLDYFYRNTIVRVMATVAPAIAGAGFSEIDTSGRNTELPEMIEGIRRSPIVGYGISNNLFDYYNSNFGGLNTIIQFGLVGFAIILVVLMLWILKLFRICRHIPNQSIYYSTGRVTYAVLVGMMAGYLTTYNYFTSFFAYDVLRLILVMFMSYLVFHNAREIIYSNQLSGELAVAKA